MGNILVLEDEESVRRGIAFTLEKNGYTVFKAGTVREAEKIFQPMKLTLLYAILHFLTAVVWILYVMSEV